MSWLSLQRLVDDYVDDVWSEPIEFHPRVALDYTTEGNAVDPDRPVQSVTGVYLDQQPSVGNQGGMSGGFTSRSVEAPARVSVTEDKIDLTLIKKGDRVYLPDRGWWFEIEYVPPSSATRRPHINLTRMQEWETTA